ncbi:MAG TPA: DinB family protein [Chthonomonadaceae bacterium]|nr:DinB family protein [Chthonomonadaceae bacterium]
MPAPSLTSYLQESTKRTQRLLANDLKALATEKHTACPGGEARTPVNIVAECAAVNGFIAEYLTTGKAERPPREQREAFLSTFDTAEKALAYLEEQTQRLVDALGNLDVNTLGDMVEGPMGLVPKLALAQLPAMHMMYHDGQLNYIQTLYGDKEMHWGG